MKRSSKFNVFHPNFGPLLHFMREFTGKIESGCLKHREKVVRNSGRPVLAAHPVFELRDS